jgi:hypothetical protein
MTPPSPTRQQSSARGVWAVTVITNLIKLAGLAVAVNEAMLRAELRPSALGVAAFMMAGAQGFEQLIGGLLGKPPSSSEEDS